MHTTLKKYNTAFTVTTAENKKLKKKTEQLEQSLDKATQESTLKKLADAKLHRDYEDAVAVLDRIPKEVLAARRKRGRLPMVDEWSGFAALLANLIEKYAVVLNLDALPNLVIEEAVSEKDDADKNIHENDIEPVKAA